jgi:hypothetical protein
VVPPNRGRSKPPLTLQEEFLRDLTSPSGSADGGEFEELFERETIIPDFSYEEFATTGGRDSNPDYPPNEEANIPASKFKTARQEEPPSRVKPIELARWTHPPSSGNIPSPLPPPRGEMLTIPDPDMHPSMADSPEITFSTLESLEDLSLELGLEDDAFSEEYGQNSPSHSHEEPILELEVVEDDEEEEEDRTLGDSTLAQRIFEKHTYDDDEIYSEHDLANTLDEPTLGDSPSAHQTLPGIAAGDSLGPPPLGDDTPFSYPSDAFERFASDKYAIEDSEFAASQTIDWVDPSARKMFLESQKQVDEREETLQDMRDRYALGDYSGALIVAEKILDAEFDHPESLEIANNCRDVLKQMYTARLGSLMSVPKVIVPPDQVRWLSLDHRAGFVLSCVDGISSFEDILDVSGMPSLDALRILYELHQQRIIAIG